MKITILFLTLLITTNLFLLIYLLLYLFIYGGIIYLYEYRTSWVFSSV